MFANLGTAPGRAVIDAACEHVYVTNPVQNRVEVLSLKTLSLEEPIQVGAQPVGLDFSLDGTKLYVANSGGNNLSVIDIAKRIETHKILLPLANPNNDRPFAIAVAGNGKAVLSTTFSGSGFGGRIMTVDLATETVVIRSDGGIGGAVDPPVQVLATYDGSKVVLSESGRTFTYSSSTDAFSADVSISNIFDVCPNASGSRFFANSGGFVLDGGLNQIGTITGGSGSRGCAIDPGGVVAYRALASQVEILNIVTFLKTGEIALPDSVTGSSQYGSPGQLRLSADGRLLVATTTLGFVVLQLPSISANELPEFAPSPGPDPGR